MIFASKDSSARILFPTLILMMVAGLLFTGCAGRGPNTINPAISTPQVVVNPDTVRLGIANLMSTDIVFKGSGFRAGDSVFISLSGPGGAKGAVSSRIKNPDGSFTWVSAPNEGSTEVIVADAKVNPDGTFQAKVGILAKVTGILRADMAVDTYSEDAKYKQALVINREPIPTGVYTARATGMLSDQSAVTQFTLAEPSLTDRFKDWIGKKMGKIQDKRS